MKSRIASPAKLGLLFLCLLLLLVFVLGARDEDTVTEEGVVTEESVVTRGVLQGCKVEGLADGELVDLGALSKGKPFYVVFSTPT